jgi:methylated-DNA-[protein]-cysteine S-methyltransferase
MIQDSTIQDSKLPEQEKYILVINSPVEFLEISGTDDFISSILFFDVDPGTTSKRISDPIRQAEKQFAEYFSGKRKVFDLPMQQTGSDFQQKVWNELTNIPFGETISYLELSKRIGDVKSIRAAGTANGKNKLNIVVPCHRVIGSDGSLTGYGGGLHRKEWLLRHEGSWPVGGQTEMF